MPRAWRIGDSSSASITSLSWIAGAVDGNVQRSTVHVKRVGVPVHRDDHE